MSKQITLTLTPQQAFALRIAAGNTMEWPDATDSIFSGKPQLKAAAYRAWDKLLQAQGATR